ncbi:hypothetical protein OXPF_09960 [Oxobacter pfennigii]|uniref:Uncharacterized protein n=1 Tax=Oxobacter pfennigii TaxID=36849 RepID=A0A0P8WAV1_9CLOT|nr:hypothetical protein [Oxobacter pfennigii]KPU45762.1 hypothetical protein OXPF_09960 [Oxobacter pfennigii]
MRENKTDKKEEFEKVSNETRVSGDIDDLIFGDEGYRCSER